MKRKDIAVGKTYRNKGAGRTTRKVLSIGPVKTMPRWREFAINAPGDDEPYVEFIASNLSAEYVLSLKSFASWAGKEEA